MEILVIDDGSTDRTAELAGRYSQKYPEQFKVFSKENGGHGSAVNYGVQQAEGKYLKVVDGDDWLEKDALPEFIANLKRLNSDVVANDFMCSNNKTGQEKRQRVARNPYHYKREWGFAEAVNEPVISIHAMTVRTAIWKENQLAVDEGCYYEDQEIVLYPIPYCTTVYYDPLVVYHYRVGRKGQSVHIDFLQKNRQQHLLVINSLLAYNSRFRNIPQYKKQYLEQGIADMADRQYRIYLSMADDRKIWKELLDFDRKVYLEHPGVYRRTRSWMVKLLRRLEFHVFPAVLKYAARYGEK
jgi:glycosyltransferase involved in cell wall biosynthesis